MKKIWEIKQFFWEYLLSRDLSWNFYYVSLQILFSYYYIILPFIVIIFYNIYVAWQIIMDETQGQFLALPLSSFAYLGFWELRFSFEKWR